MACIIRECPNPECGYADTKYSSSGAAWCPNCGSILDVTFDEVRDHDDHEPLDERWGDSDEADNAAEAHFEDLEQRRERLRR